MTLKEAIRIEGRASNTYVKLRPLGALESYFWLADQFKPSHFASAWRIVGTTSVEQWVNALSQIGARHRLLTSRIESDSDGVLCYWGTQEAIPLRILQNETARWETEIHVESTTPFGRNSTPLSRAVLIHQDHEAVLILTVHHAIADWRSIMNFVMEDLFKALAGERLEPCEGILPSVDSLLGMEPHSFKSAAPATEISTKTVALLRSIQHETLSLDEEETKRLVMRARQEKTTVHAALVNAASIAGRKISSEWQNRPITIHSPMDMRVALPPTPKTCALLVGLGSTILEQPDIMEDEADFWQTARMIKTGLDQNSKAFRSNLELLNAVLPQSDESFFLGFFTTDVFLTNLGVLSIPETYGRLRAEYLSFLIAGPLAQGLAVVTFPNRLHFSHMSLTPLKGYLGEIKNLILKFTSNG